VTPGTNDPRAHDGDGPTGRPAKAASPRRHRGRSGPSGPSRSAPEQQQDIRPDSSSTPRDELKAAAKAGVRHCWGAKEDRDRTRTGAGCCRRLPGDQFAGRILPELRRLRSGGLIPPPRRYLRQQGRGWLLNDGGRPRRRGRRSGRSSARSSVHSSGSTPIARASRWEPTPARLTAPTAQMRRGMGNLRRNPGRHLRCGGTDRASLGHSAPRRHHPRRRLRLEDTWLHPADLVAVARVTSNGIA
jgi:hypothetical protein